MSASACTRFVPSFLIVTVTARRLCNAVNTAWVWTIAATVAATSAATITTSIHRVSYSSSEVLRHGDSRCQLCVFLSRILLEMKDAVRLSSYPYLTVIFWPRPSARVTVVLGNIRAEVPLPLGIPLLCVDVGHRCNKRRFLFIFKPMSRFYVSNVFALPTYFYF